MITFIIIFVLLLGLLFIYYYYYYLIILFITATFFVEFLLHTFSTILGNPPTGHTQNFYIEILAKV